MKIYNVLIKDSHCDATATPFLDKEQALEWAKEQALECCRYKEDFKEVPINGWLYHAEYSCDGDCVWITEHDAKAKKS